MVCIAKKMENCSCSKRRCFKKQWSYSNGASRRVAPRRGGGPRSFLKMTNWSSAAHWILLWCPKIAIKDDTLRFINTTLTASQLKMVDPCVVVPFCSNFLRRPGEEVRTTDSQKPENLKWNASCYTTYIHEISQNLVTDEMTRSMFYKKRTEVSIQMSKGRDWNERCHLVGDAADKMACSILAFPRPSAFHLHVYLWKTDERLPTFHLNH